jgi:hypothetical protein
MKSREIRRHCQNALPRAESIEGLSETLAQVVDLKPVANGSAGKVEHGRESLERKGTKGEPPTGIEAALL